LEEDFMKITWTRCDSNVQKRWNGVCKDFRMIVSRIPGFDIAYNVFDPEGTLIHSAVIWGGLQDAKNACRDILEEKYPLVFI
jgi:hypothetical protein